ncbi:RNA-metabolising metallo-beta-lactamase [Staphylococcus petrasii]|nr:RNA-metabolising metallo-beta-lactamase [Staphylococcus petrasii]TGA83112.1 RNA-metabolising metallo-beta-lactamase [Staphylococcus petrasii]
MRISSFFFFTKLKMLPPILNVHINSSFIII